MTEPCVEIEGVTKRFGEDLVLKEVNLVMEMCIRDRLSGAWTLRERPER